MNYSIHAFELSLILNTEKFYRLKSWAYEKAKRKSKMFHKGEVDFDMALKDKGIKIEYHNDKYKKKIKFVVNPTRLLGGDDVLKLWKPNRDNTSKMLTKLEKQISEYFDDEYGLNDFNLTRVDFTVNIKLDSQKAVSAYIKVLNSIGKVKGFSPKYSKSDRHIDKNNSFDMKGNSTEIEFSAYDKEAESKRKAASGILRLEVRLKKAKSIKKYTDKASTKKQIRDLASHSESIFKGIVSKIIPYGDYHKKSEAEQIVKENIDKKTDREKMLKLVELIPKKKSLYLAQKEMKYRNMENLMKKFAEINLSPITISKRQKVQSLKNLYAHL
ncbi:hypothetical protein LQZ18_02485 [Lachnospiraceae bacterium ZAX-1]